MEKILDTVNREKLTAELKSCRLIKHTARKNNEIYSFTSGEAPALMKEVARLREETYRAVGCGTGNTIDIDEYDTGSDAYRQLVVWNPEDREIIGGYRYALGWKYLTQTGNLSMSHYFRFSEKFISDYLPFSIELGRAWVNPYYQPLNKESRSIFALDNLWEGIGAIIAENKNVRYLYGKVTIPEGYHPEARKLLYGFLDHYFGDKNHLMSPIKPSGQPGLFSSPGYHFSGFDFEDDLKLLSGYTKSLGVLIPPLFTAYIRLAKHLVSFGTSINPELGNSFETGMMIAVEDIYPEKYARYITPSFKNLKPKVNV